MDEAAMLDQRPAHLDALYIQACAEAERVRSRRPYTPGDDAIVSRIYLSLRARAYQREMEPFFRLAAASHAARPLPALVLDRHGHLLPANADLDPEVSKWLTDADAMVRRHYGLEPAIDEDAALPAVEAAAVKYAESVAQWIEDQAFAQLRGGA